MSMVPVPAAYAPGARRKVLIFTPEAVFKPHSGAMGLIGMALKAEGHEVLVAYCDHQFQRCIARARMPVGTPRQADNPTCALCVRVADAIRRRYGLGTLDLATLITPEDEAAAEAVTAASADPRMAEHEGFRLGRLFMHDLILVRKLAPGDPLDADAEHWLKEGVRTGVLAVEALRRAVEREGITDILVYGQYALNMLACDLAARYGLGARIVISASHNGVDRRFLQIQPYEYREFIADILALWPANRDHPLSPEAVRAIGDDVIKRLSAVSPHTYSPSKTFQDDDIREVLGLDPGRKLVVAYTSSMDEIYAQDMLEEGMRRPGRLALHDLFPDQMSWLTTLLEWMRRRPDLQLVIRIHPREDVNRRDGVRSSHLERLREGLASLPANVRVVWPQDAVSSYDLMEAADLVLNAWSSIGIEAARLGIPTITAFPRLLCSPIGPQINEPGPAAYLAACEALLSWKPDAAAIACAYRWYQESIFGGALSVADVVTEADFEELPRSLVPAGTAEIALATLAGQPIQTLRAERPSLPSAGAAEAEAVELCRQLQRIIHFLFTGTRDMVPALRILPDGFPPVHSAPPGVALLQMEGSLCTYVFGSRTSRRHSPLVARIAWLAVCPQDTAGPSAGGVGPESRGVQLG